MGQMYNTSSSPQVGYSLSALSQALFTLMKTKYFEDITITELCQKAGVSRKSFYRNCFTKTDLIDYYVEAIVQRLFTTVDWKCEVSWELYSNFFHFWRGERELLTVLLQQKLFSHFCDLFTNLCCKDANYRFLDNLLEDSPDPESLRHFNHAFLIGGLCRVLEEWTREGFQTQEEKLIKVLCYLAPTV